MPRRSTPETQAIHDHIKCLTENLTAMRDDVLARARDYYADPDRVDVNSFHGVIGGKNNVYVDSVRTQFASSQDFLARWFHGLVERARVELEERRRRLAIYGDTTFEVSVLRLARMMQDTLLRDYTVLFLERNFYRNLFERTRAKPDESLWRLWFGNNNLIWGLIIAPAHRNGEWTNDVSEIRRAKYQYWTVGHVLETGLIDPDTTDPITFSEPGELFAFYRSVLRRVSNSVYEKGIADRYVEYLRASGDPCAEPFLVPELRYAGLDKHHEHRLDYAILNPHTMSLTGFELSPHSTHGEVKGIKSKTQKTINQELAETWAKEMKKRNDYFKTFGITTVTFTDRDLAELDECFELIGQYLAERSAPTPVLSEQLAALDALDLSEVGAASAG